MQWEFPSTSRRVGVFPPTGLVAERESPIHLYVRRFQSFVDNLVALRNLQVVGDLWRLAVLYAGGASQLESRLRF